MAERQQPPRPPPPQPPPPPPGPGAAELPSSSSSRPRLLVQNRRLRHLRRVTLHNLCLVRPPRPARAADDTTLSPPHRRRRASGSGAAALPTRLSAPPSHQQLSPPVLLPHHARSTEDLRSAAAFDGDEDEDEDEAEVEANDKGKGKGRADAAGRTLDMSLPLHRRDVPLRRVVESRLADVFFSLHCPGADEPVYVSEVVADRSMNFNFSVLDLSLRRPSVSRSTYFVVKMWARRPRHDQASPGSGWFLLVEDSIDLRALAFLGGIADLTTTIAPTRPLPRNALLFHLVDGVYSLDVMPMLGASQPPPPSPRMVRSHRPADDPVSTPTYNTLMRLAVLDSAVQDVLASQEDVAAEADRLLATPALPADELPMARDSLERARGYAARQERALAAARRRLEELRESLRLRREAMREGREASQKAAVEVVGASERLRLARQTVARTRDRIKAQRRRICDDLSSIFPITTDPDPGLASSPLAFQICGLSLPNTPAYDAAASRSVGEDALSAALGLAALLTDRLQYYLGVPLPYPITAFGSRSAIRDDISLLPSSEGGAAAAAVAPAAAAAREFPLYLPRGGSTAGQFRFEYGWFLLNRDVEALCAAQGLRIVDIRHTLPNLKALLYVCGAGSDEEMPERKRGGVRGLQGAALDAAGVAEPAAEAAAAARLGSPSGASGGAAVGDSVPPDDEPKMVTLRTRGLHENIS